MSGIPSGVNKTVIISKEDSWGVKPAAGTGKIYRRVGLDLNLNRDSFESAEISSTAQTSDMRTGTDKIEGTLKAELSPGSYSDFFAALLRGAWTAGVTDTATTVAAVATGDKLVRSAGSWITLGFKVGDLVKVTGFTTTANNGRFTVLAVTATDLSLDATLTDEAEGASITTVVQGKKLSIPLLTSARTDDSFTVEQWFDTIPVSRVATGVKVSTASVKIDPNAMATVDFGMMGKDMTSSATQYFTSPAASSTTSIVSGNKGALYANGVRIATVTTISFEINGNMETGVTIGNQQPDGTRPATEIFLGRVKATGTFSAYFDSETFFNQFRDETEISLVFRLDGDAEEGLIIKFPRIKIGGSAIDDKEVGGLIQTIPFTALLPDGTSTTSEQSTVVLQDTTL